MSWPSERSWGWVACASVLALAGCTLEVVDTLAGADSSVGSGESGAVGSEDGVASSGEEGGGEEGGHEGDSSGPPPLFDVGGSGDVEVASCDFASVYPSHLGCEFFAIDVDGPGLADYEPYGYVAINPVTEPVTVRLERYTGRTWLTVAEVEIDPSDEHVFLPSDNQFYSTGVFSGGSYRITSTRPIVVIQAHPAAGTAVSASATMLQPTTAWASTTPIAGWRTHLGVGERAHFAVVARTGGTTVTVDPTCGIVDPPDSWADAWTDVDQDGKDELVVAIEPGELLRIDAAAIDSAEVDYGTAGSVVGSGQEHLHSVFSAHSCASIPDYDGTCGHMQEQMSATLLGTHFVAPRLIASPATEPDTWTHERVMVQVVAVDEPATIEFTAVEAGQVIELDSVTLQPGESYAIYEADHEVTIAADRPIVASAFMTNPWLTELGSPSMVQLAPVAQWTTRQWVWAPEGFTTHVLVTAPVTATVEVDGISGLAGAIAPASPAQPLDVLETGDLEGQGWVVHRIAVAPGIHRIHTSTPSSAIVAGFRVGDGFAYLGGWGPSLADLGPEG